jgi:hypothetical protein
MPSGLLWWVRRRRYLPVGQSLGLHVEIACGVEMRGIQGARPEPRPDRMPIAPSPEPMNRGGVAHGVRADGRGASGRDWLAGDHGGTVDARLHANARARLRAALEQHGSPGGVMVQPWGQNLHGRGPQGTGADAVPWAPPRDRGRRRSRASRHGHGRGGTGTGPSMIQDQAPRLVPTPLGRGVVGCRQHGVHLGLVQVRHLGRGRVRAGEGAARAAPGEMLRAMDGHQPRAGVDGRQALMPGGHGAATRRLPMPQQPWDDRG